MRIGVGMPAYTCSTAGPRGPVLLLAVDLEGKTYLPITSIDGTWHTLGVKACAGHLQEMPLLLASRVLKKLGNATRKLAPSYLTPCKVLSGPKTNKKTKSSSRHKLNSNSLSTTLYSRRIGENEVE